ncbi:branched-chain amino acid transport system substrate-binding protein [Rhizobium rosettiformans]|uniref:Twin-arginine translocation signal domain-containing protein n=2 Tax=Rhizobium rosettiformans TaxID=1368430 RepID=A0A4S8Q6B9_9HYPH|nr:ABC transporter substrate-binding protein [Rhizobium rosettiformans]MBB5275382.1 branched-chain amino acid transport system substrate-binding protein [Rhizobium rosettiformans]THV38821.1 twin-arginine translocation signal domain-containing protein [Rhizobium rosettiformans W3]
MITRRKFLQTTAAGGAVLATSGLAAPAIAQSAAVKLGYVSPQTGPLAAFGEADKFVIDSFLATTKKMGLNYEVVVKDSQSNPNRAAEVAKELIVDDEINLMLVSSTPETTNPVSTTCEAEQIPCLSTVAPWQPWFIGQQGNPGDPASWKPFNYAYHFFWGLEDIIAVFTGMWGQIETNKKVGGLFPNDGDGNAWGDKVVGFPPVLEKLDYGLTDTGRYQNLTDDFSAQINAFKQAETEILTGVMIPPDLTTFWNQAKQQGLKPKIASIGKALLFPQTVEALGDAGHNLSTEVWWTPSHPFKSSLTGETAADVATAFTTATGRPWTQPIGFAHALFELAVDVMKRAEDVTDGDAVAKAIGETKLDTLVGPIAWNNANLPPFAQKNVAKTPLVGGQWRLKSGGGYDLVVVENGQAPNIPLGGKMEALS